MNTVADLQEAHLRFGFPSDPISTSRKSQMLVPAFEQANSAFDAPRRGLPSSDPYRTSHGHQWSVRNAGGMHITDSQLITGVEEFSAAQLSFLAAAVAAVPRPVAVFVGRVESLVGDSAEVLLINEQTAERMESRCDAEVLRENGIGAGDEFRCEIVRIKGTISTRLIRLSPKSLSSEQVQQIRDSFKDRWQF